MLRITLAALAALSVSACGGSSNNDQAAQGRMAFASADAPMAMPAPAPPAMTEKSVGGAVNIQDNQPGGSGQPIPPGTMMAYTYGWTFKVPTGNMQDLLNAHKKLCEDAGPANCYVTNSNITGLGENESSNGQLSMRATEAWVRTFEKGVVAGLKPFDASVDGSNRSGEDLTVQIVDGEARLKSQVAFRDGLQTMLREKPGKLSDLLEIQKTLADAQADIDSRQSVLAALKLRVAMSTLTFSYEPKRSVVSESIWRPLGNAFSNFAPNFVGTLAAIVEFIGGVLPLVIFVALGVWLFWLLLRWIGRRRKKAPVPATAKSPSSGGV
ncbi:MAG TPA: DUF4349 domain-containing protein [Hyphomonadaceae bacterium]|nr:DUF4349 domain-containing protein [Hyphomonadaceae bacterium]